MNLGERSGLVLWLIIISDKHTSQEATKLHLESYFQDCPPMEEVMKADLSYCIFFSKHEI